MCETCAVTICANTHIPTEYVLMCVLIMMGANIICALMHAYTKFVTQTKFVT